MPASFWFAAIGLLALVALSAALGWFLCQAVAQAQQPGKTQRAPARGSDAGLAKPMPDAQSTASVERQVTHLADEVAFVPEGGGRSFRLTSSQLNGRGLTVGRNHDVCDVVIRDGYVSSRHARIWRDQSGLHIEDLKSKNGSWYKNRRIAKATFKYGEVIRLGRVSFSLYRTTRSTDAEKANG